MSFDRVAPLYGLLERLGAGGKMQRCRTALLGDIPRPRRVLLAGEGPGTFLSECIRRFPDAEFTVLDASAAMIGLAGQRATAVKFIHATLPAWDPPAEKFDLIVTNFFLDCFNAAELAPVVDGLAAAATPDANWLVADFEIAPNGWRRLKSRLVVGGLYRFFGLVSGLKTMRLVSPNEALKAAGFSLRKRRVMEQGLLKSEWWKRE